MQDVDVNVFLQSLQGKQSLIVLAFLIVRRAMTLEELETRTGLNNDTVRSAVRGLASKGFLFMQRGERGRQTWLPAGDTFFGRLVGQNPKISDSGSSSSSEIKLSSNLQEQEQEQAESEKIGFCLAACDEVGIRDPKRKTIARLDHVTPEFIRGHVEQCRADGLGLGTAIHRIEYNWVLDEKFVGDGSAGRGSDEMRISSGVGRNQTTLIIPGDLVLEVANFTGHKPGCRCVDCAVGRQHGLSQLCLDCKHYRCECEESEDE